MNTKTNPVKKFNLRLPMDMMEEAQQQAQAMGISVNAFCVLAVRSFIDVTREQRLRLNAKERAEVRWMAGESEEGPVLASTSHGAKPVQKVGRNDPCPCGSGRKTKQCHPAYC